MQKDQDRSIPMKGAKAGTVVDLGTVDENEEVVDHKAPVQECKEKLECSHSPRILHRKSIRHHVAACKSLTIWKLQSRRTPILLLTTRLNCHHSLLQHEADVSPFKQQQPRTPLQPSGLNLCWDPEPP
ncbi:hypothetical protein Dda_1111 [Drechslerella dactyloides]|uniref:Uncharacterized protein n=1 Tax=Drechslerella dactyloides TaxID=74499 RepID=A0AAD6J8K0_DREDA|nr:hypothetical protein Dda_1111 [Drechslerella dactyloides]